MITNTPFRDTVKETLASYWWMPLVRGILLVLFGIIMIVNPSSTLLGLIWLLGIYWIVDGGFSIFEGLRGHTEKSRVWMIVSGIFAILAGIIILINPVLAGLAGGAFISTLIGIAVVANGLMLIFVGRDGEWTWWGLIMGILYVIFGILIFANPLATIATLVWLFAFWTLVAGVIAIIMAFRLRKLGKS